MNISFSKEEYRILLDLLYLSDWMIHSNSNEPVSPHPEHDKLREKLLSYYKEMGAEDIVEYDEENNSYFESSEYSGHMNEQFIGPYDNEVFWSELSERLAERDLIAEVGLNEYESMDGMDRVKRLDEFEESYINEFENHGLQNVEVDLEEECQKVSPIYKH